MRVRTGRSRRALPLLLLAAVLAVTGTAPAHAAPGDAPPGFVPEKWAAAVFRPYYEEGPAFDFTDCQAGQSRKLWILAYQLEDDDGDVDCTIPAGTPILLGGHGATCSNAETWPFYGATDADLYRCVERLWRSQFRSAAVFIDGVKVPSLGRFIVTSDVLHFTSVPKNVFGARPGPTRAVARVVLLYLPPLSPGEHVIETWGSWKTIGSGIATFRITVV